MMCNYLEQGDSSYNISGVFEDTSDLGAGGTWKSCVIHIKGKGINQLLFVFLLIWLVQSVELFVMPNLSLP